MVIFVSLFDGWYGFYIVYARATNISLRFVFGPFVAVVLNDSVAARRGVVV